MRDETQPLRPDDFESLTTPTGAPWLGSTNLANRTDHRNNNHQFLGKHIHGVGICTLTLEEWKRLQ